MADATAKALATAALEIAEGRELTPRERFILRAVFRAIRDWERLEAGEKATESTAAETDSAEVTRLRSRLFQEIG